MWFTTSSSVVSKECSWWRISGILCIRKGCKQAFYAELLASEDENIECDKETTKRVNVEHSLNRPCSVLDSVQAWSWSCLSCLTSLRSRPNIPLSNSKLFTCRHHLNRATWIEQRFTKLVIFRNQFRKKIKLGAPVCSSAWKYPFSYVQCFYYGFRHWTQDSGNLCLPFTL